jgi:hypothetical protein
LEQDELHTFTDTMLPGCFHLLDELPDTVYRVCDLIMTAIKRNGADYRDMILKQVVNQVSSQNTGFGSKVVLLLSVNFISEKVLHSTPYVYILDLNSFVCNLTLLGCLPQFIYFTRKIVFRR